MRTMIVILAAAMCAMAAEYKLTIDCVTDIKLEGVVHGGLVVGTLNGGKCVAHKRQVLRDELPFLHNELREQEAHTEVVYEINGCKLYLAAYEAVSDAVEKFDTSGMTLDEVLAEVERRGGGWCKRGFVHVVRNGKRESSGVWSLRTMGWDDTHGKTAVWGGFRFGKGQALPIGESK